MYEQNDVPMFRRIILIVLAAIAVIVVLWVVLWLLFIRGDNKTKVATPHTTTNQQQKRPTSSQPTSTAPSGSSIAAPGTSSTHSTSGSQTTPSTNVPLPTELVNTGAGNLIVPFVAVSLAATSFYYIRTVKKLTS